MSAKGELEGRVALVTGSTRNIGRAIALALSEAGAAVMIHARSSKEAGVELVRAIEAGGGRAALVLGDVSEPAGAKEIVAATTAAFGRLDILVNNAAVRRETAFEALEPAEWREVLSVILDAAYYMTREALPFLARSGQGAVINIGGLSANTGAARRAHVVAAKAGLAGLTRALALELADRAITVNCVSPGLIATERRAATAGGEPEHHKRLEPPVGRRGTPDDISALVRFLAGPHARYVTGQTIHANGGVYLG